VSDFFPDKLDPVLSANALLAQHRVAWLVQTRLMQDLGTMRKVRVL